MKKVGRLLKKLLLILGILILGAALVIGGVRLYTVLTFGSRIVEADDLKEVYAEQQADAIVVLGCAVWGGKELSPMLKDRLDRAIECYRTGAAKKVLVSGDHEDYYDEVDHMAEYLLENGVPEEAIQRDYWGYSTYDSMYRASQVYNLKSVIVVTQQYHLYRALMIGNSWGMQTTGVAADYRDYENPVYRTVREWVATVKDLWSCLIHKQVL